MSTLDSIALLNTAVMVMVLVAVVMLVLVCGCRWKSGLRGSGGLQRIMIREIGFDAVGASGRVCCVVIVGFEDTVGYRKWRITE